MIQKNGLSVMTEAPAGGNRKNVTVPTTMPARYRIGAHLLILHNPMNETMVTSVVARLQNARPSDAVRNESPQLTRLIPAIMKKTIHRIVIDRGLMREVPNGRGRFMESEE